MPLKHIKQSYKSIILLTHFMFLAPMLWNLLPNSTTCLININAFHSNVNKYFQVILTCTIFISIDLLAVFLKY